MDAGHYNAPLTDMFFNDRRLSVPQSRSVPVMFGKTTVAFNAIGIIIFNNGL